MLHCTPKHYRIQTLAVPEQTDITQLFAHFADTPWSMLLDSANSQHKNARFDIFVAEPVATITAKGNRCVISTLSQPQQRVVEQDPIDALQDLLLATIGQEAQQHDCQAPNLPFHAGALGYFGYDLGRCFETLPNHAVDDYCSPDMAVGIYTWSVIKDNRTGKFYLTSVDDFTAPSADFIQALVYQPPVTDQPFHLTSDWQSNMSQQQYYENIDRVLAYLRAGDCYQVNLAQRFKASYRGSLWQAYLILRQANQAPFSAFIQLPSNAIVSISPERFLSVIDKQVDSQPIKGTRPRDKDAVRDQQQIQDLLNSEKDRAENLMIVDLLRNDLSKACEDGSIKVPELFKIESFRAVHHMVSTVTGILRADQHALDLLRGAFPGGSITGAPKIRAMEIIDQLEPQRRNIYCGSIGYIDINGNMDTSICIRTLLAEKGQLYCWAGGGIVLDSKASSEYQESFDKVSKILPILAEANEQK
ncbi:aminodeoxychorismate synthase component I [Aliiglaciecola sp. LCG003]|uniref:aminodeoxychorismate synthase component I n=1 Tax=Aliiglaciecola sp. LCG003 TaxID=3053655 RepID=UPI00257455EE|nr:aminodeoxychorismate synthase component I [Aliiglaciecola sp. LCG003]WJG11013.1 aminodeoxychorismate synthase component I [Aliiglaciecola sp. LCG003]